MTHLETLPLWAAIPVAVLVVAGAALAAIGALGLARLPQFYDRLHAPTLGTSWGTAAIVLASILLFSAGGRRLAVHEGLIAVFVMVTTPVTLTLLGRAALHRDRMEGRLPPGPEVAENVAPAEEADGDDADEGDADGGDADGGEAAEAPAGPPPA